MVSSDPLALLPMVMAQGAATRRRVTGLLPRGRRTIGWFAGVVSIDPATAIGESETVAAVGLDARRRKVRRHQLHGRTLARLTSSPVCLARRGNFRAQPSGMVGRRFCLTSRLNQRSSLWSAFSRQ